MIYIELNSVPDSLVIDISVILVISHIAHKSFSLSSGLCTHFSFLWVASLVSKDGSHFPAGYKFHFAAWQDLILLAICDGRVVFRAASWWSCYFLLSYPNEIKWLRQFFYQDWENMRSYWNFFGWDSLKYFPIDVYHMDICFSCICSWYQNHIVHAHFTCTGTSSRVYIMLHLFTYSLFLFHALFYILFHFCLFYVVLYFTLCWCNAYLSCKPFGLRHCSTCCPGHLDPLQVLI